MEADPQRRREGRLPDPLERGEDRRGSAQRAGWVSVLTAKTASRRHGVAVAAALCLLVGAAPAGGQVFLTQEDALRLAFPEGAEIRRRTAFLDEDQLATARELAGSGVEIDQSVLTYYVGSRSGVPVGAAYFDVHRVRTLPEVVMIVISPEERIERLEILKFSEPPEYRAPESWLGQMRGRALDDELSLRRGIRNMTGATLTSQALTRAARRVLALHRVVDPFGTGR